MIKYELAVKTGEYEKDGEKRGRYQNVGVVMDKGDGPFILLKRWFNPAAIGDGESVIISMFEPKKEEKTASEKPDDIFPDF